MTPHGFSEDQLVEQPALEVLRALLDEAFGPGGTLDRGAAGAG